MALNIWVRSLRSSRCPKLRMVASAKRWLRNKSIVTLILWRTVLEYADGTPYREVRRPNKSLILDMTLDCIWWWDSCSWALENVKYTFIAVNPRSTRTWSGNTCEDPIYGSNRSVKKPFVFNRTVWRKNLLRNIFRKNGIMNVHWTLFLNHKT